MTTEATLPGLCLKNFAEDLHASRWHSNPFTQQVNPLQQKPIATNLHASSWTLNAADYRTRPSYRGRKKGPDGREWPQTLKLVYRCLDKATKIIAIRQHHSKEIHLAPFSEANRWTHLIITRSKRCPQIILLRNTILSWTMANEGF